MLRLQFAWFSKFDTDVKVFVAHVLIVSFVTESVLTDLMADDRCARTIEALEETLALELAWVRELSDVVFQRIIDALGLDLNVHSFKSNVQTSAQIAAAFICERVFNVVRQNPFALVIGDVDANLEKLLKYDGAISDATTWKIRELLKLGYPRRLLKQGLQLIRNVNFSTVAVEQAHGSAATVHRFHPSVGGHTLSLRAFVHMIRFHFLDSVEDRAADRLRARVLRLEKRNPRHISARHALVSEMFDNARECIPIGCKMPSHLRTQLMRDHVGVFNALPVHELDRLDTVARQRTLTKAIALTDDLQHARSAVIVNDRRNAEERAQRGLRNHIGDHRFTSADMQSLADIYNSSALTRARIVELREKAMRSPSAPSDVEIHLLESAVRFRGVAEPELEPWVKLLCHARDDSRGFVVAPSFEEGGALLLIFICVAEPAWSLVLADGLPAPGCTELRWVVG